MLERLAQLDLFESVAVAKLEDLLAISPLSVFQTGERLLGPCDAPAPLYLILTGRVRLERRHPALTDAVQFVELGAGDLVGATTADPAWRAPYLATALAETESADLSAPAARALLQQILAQLADVMPAPAEVLGYSGPDPP